MTQLSVHYLPDNQDAAQRLSQWLEVASHAITVHRFPDGECRVRIAPSQDTAVIYASLNNPNEKLILLALAASALRAAGARRLVLVAPYLCYMRQDKAFSDGEAISQQVIADYLSVHFDRVVTVDPHLHRTDDLQSIFTDCKADNLSATGLIATALAAEKQGENRLLVGPDAESAQWVGAIANKLSAPFIVGEKHRSGDRQVNISFADALLIRGKDAIIVDDVISSGATLCRCAEGLRAAGAANIEAIAVHVLSSTEDIAAMSKTGISRLRSTDSINHPTNRLQLAPLLGHALRGEK